MSCSVHAFMCVCACGVCGVLYVYVWIVGHLCVGRTKVDVRNLPQLFFTQLILDGFCGASLWPPCWCGKDLIHQAISPAPILGFLLLFALISC